jgi:transcriptional regulator with XRE-family HTH domain
LNKFGENIKHLRTKARLTQRQFGEKYNTDDSNISRWEKGKQVPNHETIKKIAQDFGVSIDWLMGEETSNELDLKEIKKALLEKELVYDGHELTPEEQESIRNILLAVIEREEKKANK